jgi:hypothetical protein
MDIKSLPKRFSDKIDSSGECWIWKTTKDRGGYGQYQFKGKSVSSHRFVWEFFYGKIINGLYVLHKCDIRNCVNPDHLFLGTNKDNMKDMRLKGRSARLYGEQNNQAKLTQDQVDEIRRTYQRGVKGEFSQTGLGRKFGVSHNQIGNIVNYKKWAI